MPERNVIPLANLGDRVITVNDGCDGQMCAVRLDLRDYSSGIDQEWHLTRIEAQGLRDFIAQALDAEGESA